MKLPYCRRRIVASLLIYQFVEQSHRIRGQIRNVVPSCHVSLGSESATGSSCGMQNKWTTNHGENIVTAESVDEFQPQCHNAIYSFSVLHSTVKKPFIAFASQFSACRPEAFWSDFLFRNSALCGNDSALQCHYLLTNQHCGKSTSCLIVHPENNGSFTLIISYLHLSTVQSSIIHDHPCTMCKLEGGKKPAAPCCRGPVSCCTSY